MTDYFGRIPAAIAKAKEKLGGGNWVALQHKPIIEITSILTAGEVALADALAEVWNYMCCSHGLHEKGALPISDEVVPPSLIAFTEKIERWKP